MSKDLLLLSHNVDLDGLGSLILAKYYNLAIDKFHLVAYGEDFDEEGNPTFPVGYKNIIVTDFKIGEKLYEYIKNNYSTYKVFDHHEDSKRFIEDPNFTVDMTKSGTKLFFEYLIYKQRVPVKVKQMVTLIDTYDLWKKEDPLWEDAQNLNRVLWKSIAYGRKGWRKYEPFILRQVMKLRDSQKNFYFDDYEKVLIQEAIQAEYEQLQIAEKRKQIRKDKKGNTFIIYDGRAKISIVCSKLLELYPEIDYIINVNTFAKGKEQINGKLSVRSRGFDVTQFEEINGHLMAGGGNEGVEFATKLLSGEINELTYMED